MPARFPSLKWLGLAPFAGFVLLFLLLPMGYLLRGALTSPEGAPTLANLRALAAPEIASSYWLSIRLSLVSALMGTVAGGFLAWALVAGGAARWAQTRLHNLLRCCLELRRCAAGLRLYRDLGAAGIGDADPARSLRL